jgi:hypothetical protein
MPQEVTVNDGSVPESDISNNLYKIEELNHGIIRGLNH